MTSLQAYTKTAFAVLPAAFTAQEKKKINKDVIFL
jgi:hypothetical protein